MALRSLAALDVHKAGGFPADYPTTVRSFYAPVDDLHGALLDLVVSAARTLQVAMYALTDGALAAALHAKLADPRVDVQLTLDASQAATPYERALLAAAPFPASSIAVGTSERGALMHLKMLVVDGRDTVTGSTNWTSSGEYLQDNALVIVRNRAVAAEAQARLDAIHAHILAAAKAAG